MTARWLHRFGIVPAKRRIQRTLGLQSAWRSSLTSGPGSTAKGRARSTIAARAHRSLAQSKNLTPSSSSTVRGSLPTTSHGCAASYSVIMKL